MLAITAKVDSVLVPGGGTRPNGHRTSGAAGSTARRTTSMARPLAPSAPRPSANVSDWPKKAAREVPRYCQARASSRRAGRGPGDDGGMGAWALTAGEPACGRCSAEGDGVLRLSLHQPERHRLAAHLDDIVAVETGQVDRAVGTDHRSDVGGPGRHERLVPLAGLGQLP